MTSTTRLFEQANKVITKIVSGEWVVRTKVERSNGMVSVKTYIEDTTKPSGK